MAEPPSGIAAINADPPRADRFHPYPTIEHRYKEQGAQRWAAIDRDQVVNKEKMVKLKMMKVDWPSWYRERLNYETTLRSLQRKYCKNNKMSPLDRRAKRRFTQEAQAYGIQLQA